MAGMAGFQDITLAAKYKFFERPVSDSMRLRLVAVVAGSTPMTDYTPDFLPLSIGLGSRKIGGRMTVHLRTNRGWFVNATPGFAWRRGVQLDRPHFYTDGKLTFSDRVPMPDVFDYSVSSGLIRGEMVLSGSFSEQRTQGGGDIRRQDMPFVSNRMNFSKVGAWVKIPLPKHRPVQVVGGYSYVVAGRNVGQSSMVTVGLMYLMKFPGSRH